jgi:predicted ATPase/transcriptional regulator with XRE-family HTH domain
VADLPVSDPAEGFGEVLRRHRRAAGLTQEQLAEQAGLSARSISGLERGEEVTPRRDTVALLVRALGLAGADRAAFEGMIDRRRGPAPIFMLDQLPPASSDDAGIQPQHNLPRSLTSFVGRDQEMLELGALLGTAPLVTLTGAGGVGKTRLALQLARLHIASFADGGWLIELGELADPSLVASAVATAMGVRDVHARNTTDRLADELGGKHVLLVLDNCEHLVDACAELVDRLLRTCPNLHVLATSREPLGIDGERTWRVVPLDLPDLQLRQSAARVAHTSAVRLFVERARAVNNTFFLTDENAPAIARICVAVDGLPLGLELAAARTRLLTAEQLADRLEHDEHVLSGINRTGSARHWTIRATIDWSHDLLDSREQILLRRLSVFAGGWTLELAEDVCSGAGIEGSDVLDVLAQLVDKSMVFVDARNQVARYRLLEPVRQYALERLEDSNEATDYWKRHATAVLSLAQSSEVDDYGPDEIASLDRFEVELANLRVALRWALNHGDSHAALRASAALFRFWERRGHFQEGCRWLEEALASAGESRSRDVGWALNALTFLYWRVGAVERTQPIAMRALAVNREAGSTAAVAWALGNLGAVAYFRDKPELGVCWLEESVALGRQAGHRPFLSLALTFLARSLLRLNGPADPRAAEALAESLALAEAAQARYAMGHALMTLGDLNWRQGETMRAVGLWQRALVARSQIADRRGIAGSLERVAWALTASHQFESAAWLFGAADAQHRLLGIELRHDEEVDHADLVGVTRQHLGVAFATSWSAGQASTVDEAVGLALEITRS